MVKNMKPLIKISLSLLIIILILGLLLILGILIFMSIKNANFKNGSITYNNIEYSNNMTIEDIKNLNKGQNIMTDMFKEFDRICRKYNLKYWCNGGTLIGVVRHGGWIPWDGDIDVGMLENDYEIFKKLAKEELDNSMFFYKPWFKPCSKIRSKKAIYKFAVWSKLWDINSGLQLDIIVFKHEKDMLVIDFKDGDVVNMKYNMIFPLKEAMFEDLKVYIPNKYKEYCIKSWGGFPPPLIPVNQRFPHEGKINIKYLHL